MSLNTTTFSICQVVPVSLAVKNTGIYINKCIALTMSKTRRIASVVPKLTKGIFGQKATLLGKLIMHWPDIVGKTLAKQIIPAELNYQSIQVNGGKSQKLIVALYVRDGAVALELQYQTQQIMEKINMFTGYNAVHDLRFIQAPKMFANIKSNTYLDDKKVSKHEHEEIKHIIDNAELEKTELQLALQSLGEQILLANKTDK